MSPPLDTHAELSVEELYEQLASIEHLRVELLDGRVVVTGSASNRHDRIVYRLTMALAIIAQRFGWEQLQSHTIHIRPTRDRPRPDLIVMPTDAPEYDKNEYYADGMLLAAEVVSPSSAADDRVTKKRIYAQGGVPLYLLVDVGTVTLFSDPRDGEYRSQATVTIGEKLTLPEPFGIELDTGGLVP